MRQRVFSAWDIQAGPFAAQWSQFCFEIFQLLHFYTGEPFLITPHHRAMQKRENFQTQNWMMQRVWKMHLAFKLDHLQPVDPLLLWHFPCFFTFIQGIRLLLGEWINRRGSYSRTLQFRSRLFWIFRNEDWATECLLKISCSTAEVPSLLLSSTLKTLF